MAEVKIDEFTYANKVSPNAYEFPVHIFMWCVIKYAYPCAYMGKNTDIYVYVQADLYRHTQKAYPFLNNFRRILFHPLLYCRYYAYVSTRLMNKEKRLCRAKILGWVEKTYANSIQNLAFIKSCSSWYRWSRAKSHSEDRDR